MQRAVWAILVLFLATACGQPNRTVLSPQGGGDPGEGEGEGEGGGGGAASGIDCEPSLPEADAAVSGELTVEVALTGPVVKVELLNGDEVVAEVEVGEDVPETVTLSWDTSEGADGEVELSVRVTDANGGTETSDARSVAIDNTAPVVSFTSERLQVVFGPVTLDVEIDDPSVVGGRLLDQETEAVLAEFDRSVNQVSFDSSDLTDDLYWLALEVTDAAGNVGRVGDFPIVVAYFGHDALVEWIPPMEVPEGESKKFAWVPPNWQSGVEFHTRVMATNMRDVRKVVTWLTWDAEEDWLIEYAMGQGFCPHRGIKYLDEESRDGEIVLEIARSELPEDIVAQFPEHEQDETTFPYNTDRASFGSFFGHVAPMDPGDHVDETLDLDGHIVFIFE